MGSKKSPDDWYAAVTKWPEEVAELRKILTALPLEETIKWNMPVYVSGGRNVVGVGAFKSYFGLWFYDGALLADKSDVLTNAQAGKTQALRQWRMLGAADIKPAIVRRYVKEAIQLAADGKTVPRTKPKTRLTLPQELNDALRANPELKQSFTALTAAQRREYATYIGEAKRAETRRQRTDRAIPLILSGAGLNDRYRRGK